MKHAARGPLHGLYAITSATLCREPKRLTAAVEAALTGGARLIQYRDKESDAAQRRTAAKALLGRNPDPSESEVRYELAGNLCRCTGYDKIVRAVLAAAAEMRGAAAPRRS